MHEKGGRMTAFFVLSCREYFYFTIFRISLIKMRDTPINV